MEDTLQAATPPPGPQMSTYVVHRLIRTWLLRHAPLDWLLLTKIWWIFLAMGVLLCWLFVWGPLGGYLDPDSGMNGVWLFWLMMIAAWLVLGGLFICRALSMLLPVPDALLQALLAAPSKDIPEADRAGLRLIQQQGPPAYRALFVWCGMRRI